MRAEPEPLTPATLYPFAPRKMVIGDHTVSYVDEGQGPTVVMLHGNPTWSFFYRRLILSLRDTFRVIGIDHLGCGLSDKPQDYAYTLANHIRNTEHVLKSLKMEKFALIMHDWGGAIGMGAAGHNPEKVSGVVVMNTAAFRSSRLPLRIRINRIPGLGALLVRGLNIFARAALHMAVSKPLAPEIRAGYLAPYDSWANRIALLRFVQDIPLTPQHPSYSCLAAVEENLGLLASTPMLLLWGGRDFCFTHHFFQEWRRRFPRAETRYFADAGHYLLEDAFEAIEPLVKDFLNRNCRDAL
jgi:pimeloyl-ACP methyl ester carboxylesterase